MSAGATNYIDGIYKNVALTGSTSAASNAYGTVTVTDGVVTALEITQTGSGYTSGETLTATFGNSYSLTATGAQITGTPPSISTTNWSNALTTTVSPTETTAGTTNTYNLSTDLYKGEIVTIAGITFTATAYTTAASLITDCP